jgi:hypothetical protein
MKIQNILAIVVSAFIADSFVAGTCGYAAQTPSGVQATASTPSLKGMTKKLGKGKKANQANAANAVNAVNTFDPKFPDESVTPLAKKVTQLEGSAEYIDVGQGFGQTVHRLTKTALDRDPAYAKTAKAVDFYRTAFQRALRTTKDAVNYVYPYRGFSMSMEGSRVILDKDQKLNNLCIAELTKQRYWDEMHPKVMAKVMQISMGLGLKDPQQSEAAVQKGVEGLKQLVGPEAAEQTLAELKEWNDLLDIPDTAFEQPVWDVDTTERIYQTSLKTSADGDPLIKYVFKTVKKYDHSKLANIAAGMIEANLSAVTVLSGSPFVSLAAEGLNTAFVMTTGGPEENKILKELYFGRRLEIRRKRISDETNLALTNFQKAVMTHNAPQLAMSEVALGQLIGPEKIATVLERDPIDSIAAADAAENAPIELAKEAGK